MNPVLFNVITSAAGLAVTACAGNSPQVYFWGPFFFLPPSISTFALSSLISLRMKLWGRSAWPLWVAYVVALVMFCDDPASAGDPLGPTGTSALDNGVDRIDDGLLFFAFFNDRIQTRRHNRHFSCQGASSQKDRCGRDQLWSSQLFCGSAIKQTESAALSMPSCYC